MTTLKRALLGAALSGVMGAHTAYGSALDQFNAFVASTKSAKGEFTQHQQVDAAHKPATKPAPPSSGSFLFARPGKFIWTYEKPYVQVLQSDGEKLYVYDKDLDQVTTRKLGDALGSSPAAILFGNSDWNKNFTLRDTGPRDGLEWLEALPKAKDTNFDRIDMGMRDGVPQAMELRDSFGQTTILSFSKFTRNPPVAANTFQFVVPKGVDVLEQ